MRYRPFNPPTRVAEFDHVPLTILKLAHNRLEPCGAVMVAGWNLIQKAPHPVAEEGCDVAEVLYQLLRPFELLRMGNQFACLDGVDELFAASLFKPSLHSGLCRP